MDREKDIKLSNKENDLEEYRSANPFGNNKAAVFVYQKMERLSLALHLVTNCVPEEEPIRRAIRDKSIGMLSNVLELRSGFRSVGPEFVNTIIAKLYELSSLTEMLNAAGYMSQQNLLVLKREMNKLCVFLRQVEDVPESEGVDFHSNFFETDLPQNVQKDIVDKRHSYKTSNRTSLGVSEKQVIKTSKRQNTTQNERRNAVFRLLKDKPRITVKDALSVIPGCSSKTVQRELVAMVADGLLHKEGERRWSTYTLA
ncbi:hypothetical protein COU17_03140 [Candidatus Kaiserbacteria bacterium CG10_big_fil_rev_8_21_14_0_10_49_17]|uniref:HTH deoR-type domain-containing protein n=1 Tax=Candidatus Kaiserbacteria bacterium CG10_big_fil_rev_8_21_14_0_10_49_17 TaxID=1974609 RepID=A0A2M6WDQ1_9BACT|nr:MAG: hypothetical protein COU17_03140 [Candidatus Kaiserbacteria bacterium CG10_big_fil_rev_8_21_14_0_10_49_17]